MTSNALRFAWLAAFAVASAACSSLLGLDDDAGDDTDSKQNGSDGSFSSGASGTAGSSGSGPGTSGGPGTSSGGPGASSGSGPGTPKGTPAHVYAGESNTCVLSDTGALACWGSNASGQLAQGGPQQAAGTNVPVRVFGAEGVISAVSIGRSALGVVAGGRIFSAGTNQFGELGDGSGGRSSLALMASYDRVRDASFGPGTTCAVQESGAVSCWGMNGGLQAGADDPSTNVTAPNPVEGELVATRVAVGQDYACAASTDAIECWGANSSNRLGRDGATMTRVPDVVLEIAGTVTGLALGPTHACAIVDGGARCWGSNFWGELADASIVGQSVGAITPSGMGSGVSSVCAGQGFTCAVQNGAAKCWGLNQQGQLGIGNVESFTVPKPVGLEGNLLEVACGLSHACAVRADGAVYCWGSNQLGQLGAGITADKATDPQAVRWDLL